MKQKAEKIKKPVNKKVVIIAVVLVLVFLAALFCSVFLGLYYAKVPMDHFNTITYITEDQIEYIEDMQLENYTHIIYGFINLRDEADGPELTHEQEVGLQTLRDYIDTNCPDTKLMVTMGGSGFCRFTRTAEKRKIIVDYIKGLQEKYNIEGFDVDWEYPRRNKDNNRHCIHDGQDLLALIKDCRSAFGNDFTLSMALCGSITFQTDLPLRKLAKVLNFANVMTYDLNPPNHCSYIKTTTSIFNAFLGGFKKSQLNFGLALYSRSKTGPLNYVGYDTLQKLICRGEIIVKGNSNYSYADVSRETIQRLIDNNELVPRKDYEYEFNPENYKKGGRMYFDTFEQIMRKVKFVKDRCYGGVFTWYSEYDRSSEVISAANYYLNG